MQRRPLPNRAKESVYSSFRCPHESGSVSALSFRRRLLAVLLLCLVVGAQQGEGQAAGPAAGAAGARRRVDVGVILDRTTWLGNISWACMELALEDFYADASHANYSTRVTLHLRDTPAGPSAVDAASAGTIRPARSAYTTALHFIHSCVRRARAYHLLCAYD
jgi:hypothetical protein